MKKLTHLGARGEARMVDVGHKPVTRRVAVARATVRIGSALHELLSEGRVAKGDVFGAARIAGIMAAKKTSELIPLCHPIPIERAVVDVTLEKNAVRIVATVATDGRTGVEMEAMTAASVAALTVYDMCKSVDRAMRIGPIELVEKRGGESGVFERKDAKR